jgi:hypothetical protein
LTCDFQMARQRQFSIRFFLQITQSASAGWGFFYVQATFLKSLHTLIADIALALVARERQPIAPVNLICNTKKTRPKGLVFCRFVSTFIGDCIYCNTNEIRR